METVIVGAVILAAVYGVVRIVKKQAQKGQCTCGGNCSHCQYAENREGG